MLQAILSTEPHGIRDAFRGEYDAAFYESLAAGVPIWMRFRGCFHRLKLGRDTSDARRAMLSRFAVACGISFRQSNSSDEMLIPLNAKSSLRRMTWWYYLVTALGLLAVAACVFTAIAASRGLRMSHIPWLATAWAGLVIFVPSVVVYRVLRRAGRRQRYIRAATAALFGPASDPADWTEGILTSAAKLIEIDGRPLDLQFDSLRLKMSELFQRRDFEHAMVVSRILVGLSIRDEEYRHAGEAMTDQCVRAIGVVPD